MDRDLNDDLVLARGAEPSNSIEILAMLSNGDGTFRRMPGRTIAGGINEILLADFTGDRIPDVIASNFFAMYFLRGRGDGTFDEPVVLAAQAGLPGRDVQTAYASVDFDRDGKRDILTCGEYCSIRFGNGDGSFRPERVEIPTGTRYILADFNNDLLPDIAVMDFVSVSLFLNRGR